jgi:hypothetical protein
MMESRYRELRGSLEALLSLLDDPTLTDDEQVDARKPEVHMEMLDFDQLRATMAAAGEALEAAAAAEHEAAVVRQWLTARVVSLRRGRRALLAAAGDDDTKISEAVPLSALIHLFEEESARLRSLSHPACATGRAGGTVKATSFRCYKS